MYAFASSFMYLLQRREVEVVIAIFITLRRDKGRKADDALIMGVYNELEFWQFFESARRRQATSNAQPWRRADSV
jgi:hypothetical protein